METEQLVQAALIAQAVADSVGLRYQIVAFSAAFERLLQAQPLSLEQTLSLRAQQRQEERLVLDSGVAHYLESAQADSHPRRVVALAYYQEKGYRKDGRQGAITTRDIGQLYQEARQKKPQNFPDVIATCVRKGWLLDNGRLVVEGIVAKSWVITPAGIRLIAGVDEAA
jgi:hypothetical protein